LNDVVLNDEWSLDQVKQVLSALPGTPPPRLMRIRDKLNDRMEKVWASNQLVKKNAPGVRDFKDIVIQPTIVEEELTDKHILINIRQWFPDQYRLGKALEFALLSTMTIEGLKIFLCPVMSIPPEDIRVVKPRAFQIKEIEAIPHLDWFGADLLPETVIGGKPWQLRDGDTILFKDNRVKEKRREIRAIATNPGHRVVEHSIKIYTMEEQLERERKEQEEEKKKKEEDEKKKKEEEERIKLGLGPLPKTEAQIQEDLDQNRVKAERLLEMEQAREDAVQRAKQIGKRTRFE